eukprot:6172291-Pleurochrysis_carterae.AAC.1
MLALAAAALGLRVRAGPRRLVTALASPLGLATGPSRSLASTPRHARTLLNATRASCDELASYRCDERAATSLHHPDDRVQESLQGAGGHRFRQGNEPDHLHHRQQGGHHQLRRHLQRARGTRRSQDRLRQGCQVPQQEPPPVGRRDGGRRSRSRQGQGQEGACRRQAQEGVPHQRAAARI